MRIRDFIFVFNLPFLSQMHCYWQTKSKLSTNFNTDSVTLNFTSNLVWILSHPKQGLNSVLCFTTCSFVLIKWFWECADCCYWSYGPFHGGIWVFQAGKTLIQFPASVSPASCLIILAWARHHCFFSIPRVSHPGFLLRILQNNFVYNTVVSVWVMVLSLSHSLSN